MNDYIKELTKCLSIGVSMKTNIEGKSSEKDSGIALKYLAISIGTSVTIISLGVFIWLVK